MTKMSQDIIVKPVKFDETISYMETPKQWAVVYTYRNKAHEFCIGVIPIIAPQMWQALQACDTPLDMRMIDNEWLDYMVIGAILIKEEN